MTASHTPLILVVDDEDDVRDLVVGNLRRARLQGILSRQRTVKAAPAEPVRESYPDAVVSGCGRAEDGWVSRRVQADPQRSHAIQGTPVIMLTAKGMVNDRIFRFGEGRR